MKNFNDFLENQLQDEEFRKEYESMQPEFDVIKAMVAARTSQNLTQKELAEHLDITPAAVCGALKKIEEGGYVERTLGHDNRFNELSITDKGRELVNLTREMFSEADRSMFDGFSDEELDSYITSLEKLQANIKRQQERMEIK